MHTMKNATTSQIKESIYPEDRPDDVEEDLESEKTKITITKNTLLQGVVVIAIVSVLLNVYFISRTPTSTPVPLPGMTTIPQPVAKAYNVYVITDSRCVQCAGGVTPLIQSLVQVLPSANVITLDYTSTQGKQMYDSNQLNLLPAVLLEQGATREAGYATQMAQYTTPVGTYLSLAVGGGWDPICDSGNNCADPRCAAKTSCKPETKGTLDLFVMSRCPYGVQALNSMKEVLATLKDIKFTIHYIGSGTKGNFQSLHGAAEVTDDMLELCTMKYYPSQYMEFIWCRNKDFNADWKTCFPSEVEVAKIKTCYDTDDGATLLENDFKIAAALNIGASPTWITNGKFEFNGIDAQTVKNNFCSHNDNPGCNQTLSSSTGGIPAGGCVTPST